MKRNLSLKNRTPKRMESNSLKNMSRDPDFLDLSVQDSEMLTVDKTEDSKGDNLTQIDLRNTSLKLNFRRINNNPENTKDCDEESIRNINEILNNRHHIATLLYSLESCKKREVTPRFMQTSVDFYPYYGSEQSKNFFRDKLRIIRSEVNRLTIEKLCQSCEELITIFTDKAEYLKLKYAENNTGNFDNISSFQSEITKLVEKWDKEFQSFANDYDDKLKTPPKEEKNIFLGKQRKDKVRGAPYMNRNK